MQADTLVGALILGLVEGLTEFIPVSSTGHILLLGHFIGFESTGKTFEVLIQLGAILAILTVYFQRLLSIALALPHQAAARRFVAGILLAFLPAAVIGVMAHGFIKACLLYTSSLSERVSLGTASYCVSKAGVVQMTRALALEFARNNIRVNAIEPGYFETEINEGYFETDAGKATIRQIPMRRIGQFEDLDGPFLLLASDASRFMTGAAIPVDGGHLLA